MSKQMQVRVARVYDDPKQQQGRRVLIDRLWPRGLSKENARLDEWLKEVAPSTELRKWYAHEPAKFAAFCDRYRAELDDDDHREALERLRSLASSEPVTLLSATKVLATSQLRVLVEALGADVPEELG